MDESGCNAGDEGCAWISGYPPAPPKRYEGFKTTLDYRSARNGCQAKGGDLGIHIFLYLDI